MNDMILVINAGSSSVKLALYPHRGGTGAELTGAIDRIGGAATLTLIGADGSMSKSPVEAKDHAAAVEVMATATAEAIPSARISAIGHRIVHGGTQFSEPTRLSPETITSLEALIPLAPLHQPHSLRGVREAARLYPHAPQIACFDTAFHMSKPWLHDSFALPQSYYEEGLRRYGFHGLSCQSILRGLLAEDYPLDKRNIVIAHLGNGCSVTAVKGGRAHATSMGFSTLDGLVMGTRSGSIDPGVLLYWLRQGKDVTEIESILYQQSGLLGLSGISNDMRDLEASDNPAAATAIETFIVRAAEEICRLSGAMGGLDAVVFCGGIGENAASVRERISKGLSFIGPNGPEILVRITREEEEIMLMTRSCTP